VASYTWSFGDGTTASGPNVGHIYANAGSYPVTLTVTDAVGNATTRTATTAVAAPLPAIGMFRLTRTKIAALQRNPGFETVVPDLLNQRTVTDLLNQRTVTATKTKLKVRLNTAATLKLVVKSKHRHLVKGKKKYVRVVLRKQLPAGLSKITIKARIKGKLLRPDTYVITGTAKNTTGKSPHKKTKLKVVR
jgi:PKD repeat protein